MRTNHRRRVKARQEYKYTDANRHRVEQDAANTSRRREGHALARGIKPSRTQNTTPNHAH